MKHNEHESKKLEQTMQSLEQDVANEQNLKDQFQELSAKDLQNVLGATIKKDDTNKLITFLGCLSAYTESSQFNISFNAPSSTGKSYIPLQIASLFPKEDLIKLSYVSPTAFFHEMGELDKETQQYKIDLSRKIIIFLDQPHNDLLARLRPLFSHDEKEIVAKITDKAKKSGLRTKTVVLKGFPAVVFCTAGLSIDEQEATRFFLLSPEISQEKLRQAIFEKMKKESDVDNYSSVLDANDEWQLLKKRVLAVKQANVTEVIIPMWEKVHEWFVEHQSIFKPRHQRDVNRLMAMIKMFALVNFMYRKRSGSSIIADEPDIKAATKIWEEIAITQDLNIPPYIYHLYQDVIVPGWQDVNEQLKEWTRELIKSNGVSRQQIMEKHYSVYGRMVNPTTLRQQIIPMLETAGLIMQDSAKDDNRKRLIFPTTVIGKRNSEVEGGSLTIEDINF